MHTSPMPGWGLRRADRKLQIIMTALIAAVLIADTGLVFFTAGGLSGRSPLEVISLWVFAYASFLIAVWAPGWFLLSTVPSIALSFYWTDYERIPVLVLAGLLTLTALGSRRWLAVAWGWAVAWTTATALVFAPAHRVQFLALMLVVVFLATSVGIFARRYFSQRDHHAHQLARVRELEQQSYEQELLLLAQDIHDSIGHALTRAALQVQRLTAPDAADTARQATAPSTTTADLAADLSAVRTALDEAIVAMHHIVDVLENRLPLDRTTTSIDLDKELSDLVDVLRSSGRRVSLVDDAAAAPELSPSIQIECIRILQECTTNILRHSPRSARVGLKVRVTAEAVAMEVSNTMGADGSPLDGPPGPGGHHGLSNMEARAIRLGGFFHAGADDGQWTVVARIPVGQMVSSHRTEDRPMPPVRGVFAPEAVHRGSGPVESGVLGGRSPQGDRRKEGPGGQVRGASAEVS
ncbi:hypothetical protein [Raineyella sp.]|uniref:sensor histidine kinase n=1 Tax=Raineyella sp. TaxID=1911550 RepID=UPI002B1F15D8|nr:hypothetical protein [Raineyella sp.]MEA5154266.1 hypothetical protein [Raineyella sp.]